MGEARLQAYTHRLAHQSIPPRCWVFRVGIFLDDPCQPAT